MRFIRTETRIFVAVSCLSVVAFFATFMFFLPLIYEHQLVSSRLSLTYLVNFLYALSFYFVLAGVLSVVVYRFIRPMREEVKIFIVTFATIFWTIIGALATASLYWGNPVHPLDPLGVIVMWGDWSVILAFSVLGFFILAISTLSVIIYKIYKAWASFLEKAKMESSGRLKE